MKLLLICLIFAPIVYLAAKQKKWYLYLAFAFLGILPDRFAIEFSKSLPLLTFSRILILLLIFYWVCFCNGKLRMPKSLLAYACVNLLVSVINLRFGMGEVNRFVIVLMEQVLLVIAVAQLIQTREEFERCIDFMIMGCTALAVIGVMQTALNYDISTVLNITESRTDFLLSDRMGMTRASGTTNAINYGCYCAFMCLPILYRLEQTGKQRYAVAFLMNFVALLCTMSRSAWLCIGVVMLVLVLVRGKKVIRPFLPYIPLAAAACVAIVVMKPSLISALMETLRSTLNTFGANLSLSTDFGLNGSDPAYSRLVQWTAVEYMAMDGHLLLGHGYNSFIRGQLRYFYRQFGYWTKATTLDVGWVSVIGDNGLVGAVCLAAFLLYIWGYSFRKKGNKQSFDFYKMMVYLIPVFFLLNFMAAFLNEGTVWLVVGLFFAYRRLDSGEVPEGKRLSVERGATS